MIMVKQLSFKQAIACGVEKTTAAVMLPQIERWLSSLPAPECWQRLTQLFLKPNHPFSLHELLYETTFDRLGLEARDRPRHGFPIGCRSSPPISPL